MELERNKEFITDLFQTATQNTLGVIHRPNFNWIHGTFHLFLDKYVNNHPHIIFPIAKWGKNIDYSKINEIREFREFFYKQTNKYLLTEEQYNIEKYAKLDKRSYHLITDNGKNITGCLRLIPYPFEINFLPLNKELDLSEFSEYLEINRLMTDQTVRGTGQRILIKSGLDSLRNGYKGYVALCKPERFRLFKRYGLKLIERGIRIESRGPHEYYLIAATFKEMSIASMKEFSRGFLGPNKKFINKFLKPN